MTRVGHPIHQALLKRVNVASGEVVLDIGCGQGGLLLALAQQQPSAVRIGLDRNWDALSSAQALLGDATAPPRFLIAELSQPLPLRSGSIDVVACHNVLECLVDPSDLLDEAFRALRPGGRAVWSHTDFDSIVINVPDLQLTRRVVHVYADCPQAWMDASDGQMGRKIAGLVHRSPLVVDEVHAQTDVATELTGDARSRIDEMGAVLRKQAQTAEASLTAVDVQRWVTAVQSAAATGDFLYAETAFMVVCHRPS